MIRLLKFSDVSLVQKMVAKLRKQTRFIAIEQYQKIYMYIKQYF